MKTLITSGDPEGVVRGAVRGPKNLELREGSSLVSEHSGKVAMSEQDACEVIQRQLFSHLLCEARATLSHHIKSKATTWE